MRLYATEESPKIEDRECEAREAAVYTFIFCALYTVFGHLKTLFAGGEMG